MIELWNIVQERPLQLAFSNRPHLYNTCYCFVVLLPLNFLISCKINDKKLISKAQTIMPELKDRVPENGEEYSDDSQEVDGDVKSSTNIAKKKVRKRGIIYLSTIPPYMNVAKIREIFSESGDVGRVYLQSTAKPGEKRKRVPNQFSEGWVEFKKKKIAKLVAANMNNTKIGTRKKSRYYDMIWNIKYIPRFKWVHLSERLAYERAAMKQRLRAEISQAKKEAHYLQNNVEKSKKLKKKNNMEAMN